MPDYRVNAPVPKITVPDNRLRELRDVEGLAESIGAIGLLHPITITESGVLVSGWHRLEAVKRLGWKEIPAFVVEDDELDNRLLEIDENLKRLDLTVWEQGKHVAEREWILKARLERKAAAGRPSVNGDTVSPLTTPELASRAGMAERTYQRRHEIGRDIGKQTAMVLDHADVEDDKQRNLLNSTTQLNHLANISRKHGDEMSAQVAERALTEEGGNVFTEYEKLKQNVHYMSESGEWYTPPHIVEHALEALGGIDLDPCAEPDRAIPALRHFTREDDGLARLWHGRVYMNPPYHKGSSPEPWIVKLTAAHEAGDVPTAIALLPARTDTEWFALLDGYPRCFVRGRLKFSGGKNSAPFPSAAIYLGKEKERFVEAFASLGTIFEKVGA